MLLKYYLKQGENGEKKKAVSGQPVKSVCFKDLRRLAYALRTTRSPMLEYLPVGFSFPRLETLW